MMFGAPMLLLWLLSLVFTQKDYIPQIAVVDMPAQIVKSDEKSRSVNL